jgi:hypothetical protein
MEQRIYITPKIASRHYDDKVAEAAQGYLAVCSHEKR